MMRALSLLLLLASVPVRAQDVPAHAVPFGASGVSLELAVGGASERAARVVVAEAPAWVVFESREAAVEAGGVEAVARLAFAVGRVAPVGEVGAVVLHVEDASGAVVAVHTVRVSASAPAVLAVSGARPNPSWSSAVVEVSVPEAGAVRVVVVDVLGREVLVASEGERAAGAFEVGVDVSRLASGVYVVRAEAGGRSALRRITVAR